MTRTKRDDEITERLRSWIEEEYGNRGRFSLLERESDIPAQRWKNVFYQRQFATSEMLEFVHKKSTNSHQWITTGIRLPKKDGYPFDSPPTADERSTLTNRLVWAVKEFASPRGAALFTYLEDRWHNTVSADEWAAVILGKAPATALMIEQICKERPHLAAWIATGTWTQQVDPTDEASVEQWKQSQRASFDALTASFRKSSE